MDSEILLEKLTKKTESFLINLSIKHHYKKQEYSRDLSSATKYLNYFKHTSLQLFLPVKRKFNIPMDKSIRIGTDHYSISFPTPYNPVPLFDEDFQADKKLHETILHYFPYNKKRTSRALIYFHGWGRDSFFVEKQFQFRIFQKAYKADIYALELPYHHNRNPRGFSGQGFLDSDVVRTIEAFRQATIEGYYIYQYLNKIYDDVGAIGVSLGAHILTMFNFLLNQDMFSLICLVGSPLKLNMRNLSISPNMLRSMKEKDVVSALTLLDFNKIPVKHYNKCQFLFGGKFDLIITPQSVINLGRHIKSKTYMVPTGHFTFPLYFPHICSKIAHWPKN